MEFIRLTGCVMMRTRFPLDGDIHLFQGAEMGNLTHRKQGWTITATWIQASLVHLLANGQKALNFGALERSNVFQFSQNTSGTNPTMT